MPTDVQFAWCEWYTRTKSILFSAHPQGNPGDTESKYSGGEGGRRMLGWWFTATPQKCSGCGGTNRMVSAREKRCLPCYGVIFPVGSWLDADVPVVETIDPCPVLAAER